MLGRPQHAMRLVSLVVLNVLNLRHIKLLPPSRKLPFVNEMMSEMISKNRAERTQITFVCKNSAGISLYLFSSMG